MNNIPTPHIEAKKGEIAKTVLFPGDPLRAKYIADNFLENVKCVNKVRGMFCFTGEYKSVKVSVMGSGMGIPSSCIYAYELYKFYDVDNIIRIGSCGGYHKDLKLLDTILVDNSYSVSNFAKYYYNIDTNIIASDITLTNKLNNVADNLDINIKRGTILTSDAFDYYFDVENILNKIPNNIEILGAEMESFGIFTLAKNLNKKAACLLSVVDLHTDKTQVSSEDRQSSLNNMIKIALEAVVNIYE